ncbi:uncharacterized protein LOC110861088 isoform X2 [Folsomia candida]|uniref:uncharacterized protein LOC110861088 isoform X2 n=1 Tax=Folsomia candida TaxID=158441 RepID=UPI001604B5E9|nr:uncharacterized protein LOC110861088 isoform X2 [Folsomia candida]
MVAPGVGKFFLNAILSALLSSFGNNLNHDLSTAETWLVCRNSFQFNATYCDNFDHKMNHGLSKLSENIDQMQGRIGELEREVDLARSLKRIGGFNPPDPAEVQKEIDQLKQEIIDLQTKLNDIDKSADIATLDAQMAAIKQSISDLTQRLDTLWKEGQDQFKAQIQTLTDALNNVVASIASINLEIAQIEQDLEEYKIVNIVADIVNWPDEGTAYRYEMGSFKADKATVMSTIISLAYVDVVDKGDAYFVKILRFLSLLQDVNKLVGAQALYFTILTNNHYYDKPHPILCVNMLSQLLQSDQSDVVAAASKFLKTFVPPILYGLVVERAPNNGQECIESCQIVQQGGQDGQYEFSPPEHSFDLDYDFGNNEFNETAVLPKRCAPASGGLKYVGSTKANLLRGCFGIQRGSKLAFEWLMVQFHNDWDTEQLPSNDCYTIQSPQVLEDGDNWSLFGKTVLCRTP